MAEYESTLHPPEITKLRNYYEQCSGLLGRGERGGGGCRTFTNILRLHFELLLLLLTAAVQSVIKTSLSSVVRR